MHERSQFQIENPLSQKIILKKIICKAPFLILGSFFISFAIFVTVIFIAYMNEFQLLGGWAMILFPLSLLILPLFSLFIYYLYIRKYLSLYFYDISNDYMTIQKGVFTSHQVHISFDKVVDIYINQDLIDKLFGIYDIHLMASPFSSLEDAHVDGVSKETAEKIKVRLLDRVYKHNQINVSEASATEIPTTDISSTNFLVSALWMVKCLLTAIVFNIIWVFFAWVGIFWPEQINKPTLTEALDLHLQMKPFLWLVYILSILLFLIYSSIIKKNTSFQTIGNYLGVTKSSLFSTTEKHIAFSKIQKMSIQQGIFDRLLGIADIVLQITEGETPFQEKKDALPNRVILFGLSLRDATKLSEKLKKELVH